MQDELVEYTTSKLENTCQSKYIVTLATMRYCWFGETAGFYTCWTSMNATGLGLGDRQQRNGKENVVSIMLMADLTRNGIPYQSLKCHQKVSIVLKFNCAKYHVAIANSFREQKHFWGYMAHCQI